jgi:hypothetical protein
VNFDGSAPITVPAAAGTLTGATLAANVLASSLTSVGVLASPHMTSPVVDSGGLVVTGNSTITGTLGGVTTLTATTVVAALTGNASTATALATARAINGTNFDGTAPITVTAAAGTLTGATLAAGVTASSLTSVGVLATPHMTTAVVDSGGLTVTAGGLTLTAGNLGVGAAPSANITMLSQGAQSGASSIGFNEVSTLTGTGTQNLFGIRGATTLVSGASGTPTGYGLFLNPTYSKTTVDFASQLVLALSGIFAATGSNRDQLTINNVSNTDHAINSVSTALSVITGALNLGSTLKIGSRGAFVAADKYLICDSSGNVHVSATGPAS